jgi:transposase InsO family protein
VEKREECLELIGEAMNNGARKEKACEVLGVSVRTIERWDKSPIKGDLRKGPETVPANKLTPEERQMVIQVSTSEQYKDLPPSQIVPSLADDGTYIASEATFYRILKEEEMLAHRNDSKPKKRHKPDEFIATAPNQVWSWDVTYLKTHVKGLFFYLYMIMDVFSRKIVGWNVHFEDNAENAGVLVEITCMVEGIEKGQIVLHSDNGASQKGATMLGTLQNLGVAASFSRPSVSNDNPYSESLFKTLKYCPMYPENGFATKEQAMEWVEKFVVWYNTIHLHSGIKFVTPDSRHNGYDKAILEARKDVYRKAKESNPNRWSRGTRNWNRIEHVLLNPLKSTREVYNLKACSK